VWDYARAHGFAIASKDADFRERSYVEGAPPKVIWLDVGHAGTDAIAQFLQEHVERARRFDALEEASLLILSISTAAL
jgi:predicted nuclease of predicted toxin-antitoxin system